MNAPVILDRRRVLAGGGALIVSFSLTGAFAQQQDAPAAAPAPSPPGSLKTSPYLDSWIRIDADGSITVFTGKAELGQGFKTAFQQIAAEELDVPFASLKVVTADTELTANEGYTSGSNSMQGQRHRDPERGGSSARSADRGSGHAARSAGRKPADRKWCC